jgi:hypothetical protein
MATVPGGFFDPTLSTTFTAEEGDEISSFLSTLGIGEGSLTTVNVTIPGGAMVFQGKSTTISNVVVAPTNVVTTVTIGGAAADIGITSGDGSIGFQSNPTPTTAGGVQTLALDIITDRIPDTATGNQLRAGLENAIADATSSIVGGSGGLAVIDFLGSGSNSTINLTNVGFNAPVTVLNAGTSGSTVVLSGYSDVISTGNVKIDASSGNTPVSVAMVSGNTTVVGGAGNDSIIASYGSHSVFGGMGSDTFGIRSARFVITSVSEGLTDSGLTASSEAATSPLHIKTSLVISDFSIAQGDKLNFSYEGIDNFAEFKASLATAKQIGADVVAVTRDGDTITLTGVNLTALTTDMFTFG